MKDLRVGDVISNALTRGIQNLVPILSNAVLWVLTIWIPYINVGTTIGLVVGLPAKAARNEPISYTEIFNPRYRKYMGDYFLVTAFVCLGTLIGTSFLLVPGIILSFAWLFAPLLTVDQGMSPLAAIQMSNNRTYGQKKTIFLTYLVIAIISGAITGILGYIAGAILGEAVAGIVGFFVMLFTVSFSISAQGYLYAVLCLEENPED
ncbi:hypothetical protein [Spirochaeta lutea]|uniref:Glycerophosphoryl diester phosphodiesterase membrane domain-containing protein n=1 Tax=Spirochaeta lutea TaxID=1480694 RepID=A0A098QW41_9SPIO|nr:hypothetical protein [Spirochaeta lutea]KGE71623.1 hypothetical protein DC28_10145 [Spirochaeta lutea]